MKKIIQFEKNLPVNIKIGKNSIFKGSWCEIDENSGQLICGKGTKLISAMITINSGGKLIIGDNCTIRGRIIIDKEGKLLIGHGLQCNFPIKISVNEKGVVRIGNECLFSNIQIWNSDMHSIFDKDTGHRINNASDINISDRVWLGSGSIVLKGSQVSSDIVVGAHSIVNGSYPSNCIIAGSPATIVKKNITWSRHLLEQMPMQFDNDFSPSSLVAAAQLFQHKEVIKSTIIYIDRYTEMDKSNYFIFYYLARAIFEEFFITGDNSVDIYDRTIDLFKLCKLFRYAWNTSECKNHVCGSYLYLTSYMLGDLTEADKIYKLIESKYSAIKKFQERIEKLTVSSPDKS